MQSKKGAQILARRAAETAAVALVPIVAGLATGARGPAALLPYALVFPFVASFRGLAWSLGAGIVSLSVGLGLFAAGLGPSPLGDFGPASALALLSSLSLAFGIAYVRSTLRAYKAAFLRRFRRLVRAERAAARRAAALESVNGVIESRIASQRESITLLHERVRRLATLDLGGSLETILETAALFTGMTTGSIWRPSPDGRTLVPVAVRGWPIAEAGDAPGASLDEADGLEALEIVPADDERDAPVVPYATTPGAATMHVAAMTLDAATTVEGYVLRNAKPFSAHMLLADSEFDRFACDRCVMAYPVLVGSRAWGVLAVEDLPFERYSRYTETILAILLSLAEPYLRATLARDSLEVGERLDPGTGFPAFGALPRALEEGIARSEREGAAMALVVLEIANCDALAGSCGRMERDAYYRSLRELASRTRGVSVRAFHYREDNQVALLVDGLDRDGASYFCLGLLSDAGSGRLGMGGASVPVELRLGFSTSGHGNARADDMIRVADAMLAAQRG